MNKTEEIPIAKIKVGEYDQRLGFDEDTVIGLMTSIPRVGLLYPILVKKVGDEYLVVDGHTRLEAFRRLGRDSIDCIIAGAEQQSSAEIAFAGNFFRKDLSPVELGSAIADCCKNGTMTIAEIAIGFHRSEYWVQALIDMCGWPKDVLAVVHSKELSVAAASNLALVTDDEYRQFLVRNAVEQGATARTTSAWLQAFRNTQPQEEAIQAEPVSSGPTTQPLAPQAPCFCCTQVKPVNEMSHIPVCGPCIQAMRNVG